MQRRKAISTLQNSENEFCLTDRGSQLDVDEQRKAFNEGVAAANAAFGCFSNLLSNEIKKRKNK